MNETVPRSVHEKHGSLYWVSANRWHFLGREIQDARPKYNELRRALGRPADWPDPRVYTALLQKAKANAAARKLPFELEVADLEGLIAFGRHRCALTGIEFDLDYRPSCSRRPYAPSIDRIDATIGYHRGNVRLVCFAVNVALADWGEEVLRRVAHAYASKNSRKTLRRLRQSA